MWCPKCQAEVAAEASADNLRIRCTSCGTDVGQPVSAAARGGRPSRDPRELLARWAEEDAADPFSLPPRSREPVLGESSPAAGLPSAAFTPPDPPPIRDAASAREATGRDEPARRIDVPWAASSSQTRRATNVQTPTTSAHSSVGAPAPHFVPVYMLPPHAASDSERNRYQKHSPHRSPKNESSTRWMQTAGQVFAYLGVVTLFIGSVLILVGYFGDLPSYAPTGWLVSTAGQMLLFLGVVTLITGGLESSTAQIMERLDALSNQLERHEQLARSRQADSRRAEMTSGSSIDE